MSLSVPAFAAVLPNKDAYVSGHFTIYPAKKHVDSKPQVTLDVPYPVDFTVKFSLKFKNTYEGKLHDYPGWESFTPTQSQREVDFIARLRITSGEDETDANFTRQGILSKVYKPNETKAPDQAAVLECDYKIDGGENEADKWEIDTIIDNTKFQVSQITWDPEYTGNKPEFDEYTLHYSIIGPGFLNNEILIAEVTAKVPELPAGALAPVMGLIGFGTWFLRRKIKK